ncbi:hypothetical protein [Lachnobacterium bovis]|uniref:hypothetical protein n=1 Tax=Lachnobacterium bovis TaxID=140626 RepID=UPI0003B54EAC|nr:hypothetical protein [Lachnobacterium bovis]
MAIVTGFNSQSIGMLFSSNQTNNFMSNIYKLSSDYSTVKSGNYRQLINSYIKEIGGNKNTRKLNLEDTDSLARIKESLNPSKESKTSTSTSKESNKTIAEVEKKANDLINSAKELNIDKKLYDDTDKTFDKVKDFVNKYNDLVKEKSDIKSSTVEKSFENMITTTKSNEKLLSKVGITVNEDKTLKIDEDVFKKADKDTLKLLFADNASYGYSTRLNASMIEMNAKNEANKSNTYNINGAYNNNYNTGSLFNFAI